MRSSGTSGPMRSLAIVDASALYASLDRRDAHHRDAVDVLSRAELRLVIPTLVIAEVAYVADTRLGPSVEAAFIRGLADLDIEPPAVDDWPSIADLVERYADMRLGTTDASIAVLADRLATDLVITFDRRHFEAVRTPAGRPFRILPERSSIHDQAAPYRT